MRRLAVLIVLVLSIVALGSSAGADVSNNPNAAEFGPIWCPEAELFFESAILPAPGSNVGVGEDVTGVAVSLYITDSQGNRLAELLDRPGVGLDQVTVACYWQNSTSPTGFAGGDIIFNANLRP